MSEKLSIKERLEKLEMNDSLHEETIRQFTGKKGKKPYRIKRRYQSRRKYRKGLIPCVWLGSNHVLDFRWAEIKGGLIKIGEYEYKEREEGAIYFYKRKPFIIAFEWRLTLVGGKTEEHQHSILKGGKEDESFAKENGLSADAQQTIIKAVVEAEIDKESGKKKKGKLGVGFIILIGAVAVFLIGKALGLV